MSIQEIALSNNLKKKLLKSIKDESVIFEDDNGDLVVSVEAYINLKHATGSEPIETLLGDTHLDLNQQYFVFS